jgi:2,4-dienoyl-CoA reductase-like NADH-dependent reductase (Old Yellow Enzyme family)
MADRTKFAKLLEPGKIGRVTTKNKIIKTASGYRLAEPGGIQGEAIKGHYEALTKGGVGLIINKFTAVEHPRGARWPTGTEARIDDDRFITGFSEVTKAVHKHGPGWSYRGRPRFGKRGGNLWT